MPTYKKKFLSEATYGKGIVLDQFIVGGALDTTFDPSVSSTLSSIVLQSDGKILLGGFFTSVSGTTRNRIARVHANGALDTTFNPSAANSVRSIVQQSDGKILLGGNFTSIAGTTRNRIARVHANGALDTTFNPNVSGAYGGSVDSIALQSDGKILLGGEFNSVAGTTRNCIARMHANGALDTTFNPNVSGAYGGSVNSIALQSDGKILLGGNITSVAGTTRNRIARVHANGALDTTFNPNASGGLGEVPFVSSIVQQSDGKILLAGDFKSVGGTTRNFIASVHANGALDTTFNPNANNILDSIALQSDGKILLGGNFTSVAGTTRDRIARVHANGALDTTFDPSANDSVRSIALQSDGKILLGGGFTSVAGTTRNRIARLEDSPSSDPVHFTSDSVESLELFAASTSSSPDERDVIIYADEQAIGKFSVDDNSGAKKIFSIPPTFGAGVEITANRTSLDYTLTIFGHVNVQEDDE